MTAAKERQDGVATGEENTKPPESGPLARLHQAMQALQAGDLEAEADNPTIVRCWERLGCQRQDCPAYGRLRCWAIAGTLCHQAPCGDHARRLGDCRKCVVYQESCADDTARLLEEFNLTVRELRYRAQEESQRLRQHERLIAVEEMAATVAHQARNPLQAITTALAFLKRQAPGDVFVEFLAVIDTEVQRLARLIDSFVRFAQPVVVRPRPTDLNHIARQVADLYREEAGQADIRLELRLPADGVRCTCDPDLIRTAVAHLVDNALAAAPPKSTVTIATGATADQVRLSVRDHGPGVAAADRPHIFQPFFTTTTQGSGLGLAVALRAAQRHGGTITVADTPGTGATFTLVLPREAPAP